MEDESISRLSIFAGDLAWHDVAKLMQDRRTVGLADQLYRAIGSVGANIAEGYSRRSGKDRARFCEYSLGSAREARGWYHQGRHILTEAVSIHRMQLLTEIIRMLLTITPATRSHNLAEERTTYEISPSDLLDDPPVP